MLEGYLDLLMAFICICIAFLIGEHIGEVRGNLHYYLEEIIIGLRRKEASAVAVPKPPLPAFNDVEVSQGKQKVNDYLGV
jgi:hypothetical protein